MGFRMRFVDFWAFGVKPVHVVAELEKYGSE